MVNSSKISRLEQLVRTQYESKDPNRASDWADFLYEYHIFHVDAYVQEVCSTIGLQEHEELARAGALLHDIGDSVINRFDETHDQRTSEIARDLMERSGFEEADIAVMIDDMLPNHSCNGDENPESEAGKILATADAMAHTLTDYYVRAAVLYGSREGADKLKVWALKKLEKDFNKKVKYEEVRRQIEPQYRALKELFSR